MQIDFSSTGGFANLQLDYRADTKALPEEQAKELESLVESSGAFDVQQTNLSSDAAVGPTDVISYRLLLSDGPRQTTLWVNDVTAPAALRPLLAMLRKLALEEKRKGA